MGRQSAQTPSFWESVDRPRVKLSHPTIARVVCRVAAWKVTAVQSYFSCSQDACSDSEATPREKFEVGSEKLETEIGNPASRNDRPIPGPETFNCSRSGCRRHQRRISRRALRTDAPRTDRQKRKCLDRVPRRETLRKKTRDRPKGVF